MTFGTDLYRWPFSQLLRYANIKLPDKDLKYLPSWKDVETQIDVDRKSSTSPLSIYPINTKPMNDSNVLPIANGRDLWAWVASMC